MQELLQHPLLAEEEEPPSPSPLMLKIPTAPVIADKLDKHAGPASPTGHHGHRHSNGPSFNAPSSLSASRRYYSYWVIHLVTGTYWMNLSSFHLFCIPSLGVCNMKSFIVLGIHKKCDVMSQYEISLLVVTVKCEEISLLDRVTFYLQVVSDVP